MDYKKKYLKYKKKYLMAKKLYGGGAGITKAIFKKWILNIQRIITDMETALKDPDEEAFPIQEDYYREEVDSLASFFDPKNKGAKLEAHHYKDDKLKELGVELWGVLKKFEGDIAGKEMVDIGKIIEPFNKSIKTIEEKLKQEENKE